MKLFSTEQGIVEMFGGLLTDADKTYKKIINEAPQGCKHVVSSENFGRYMTALAKTLGNGSEGQVESKKDANCLLLTAGHVMALHLQRKSEAGVSYFAAKVYDPKDTSTYKRVEGLTPEAMGSLKLQDMMISGSVSSYAGARNAQQLSLVAVSLDHDLQPKMDRRTTVPSPENMQNALYSGVHEDFHAMLQSADQSPDKLFTLLQAKIPVFPVPGFYLSLGEGHTETVKAFADTVLKSNFVEGAKVELLAAKSRDGTHGLFTAFQGGHTETVKAFADAVLKSEFGTDIKVELLAGKRDNGLPGLQLAFQRGYTKTVRGFADTVLKSNADESTKVELLAAKHSGGMTGLAAAFRNRHKETGKAFAEAVLHSNLSENAKTELVPKKALDWVQSV